MKIEELDKIYNEDCLQVLKRMPDNSIDMVLTSPPYDNLRTYGGVSTWNYNKFCKIAKEITRVLKKGGVCVWVVSDASIGYSETGSSFYQALFFKRCGLCIYDTMIWQKANAMPLNHARYEQSFEFMFVFSKGKPKTFNPIMELCYQAGRPQQWGVKNKRDKQAKHLRDNDVRITRTKKKHTNVFTYDIGGRGSNPTKHPAIFPEKLAIDQIISWSNEGDIVLDPFMGSGTTAVACHRTERHFVGCEINKDYYNAACKRIDCEQRQTMISF